MDENLSEEMIEKVVTLPQQCEYPVVFQIVSIVRGKLTAGEHEPIVWMLALSDGDRYYQFFLLHKDSEHLAETYQLKKFFVVEISEVTPMEVNYFGR